ncbi:hypothetical protein L4174_014705 [Photobacterium sp. CCB-ST2H9]|uniref:hypothetical protein n=1 Tax=Photobacterium sp. CCB-ST2H9 TaxID=2912855 RepID=UPI0020C66721|nr:hypothetical protein [Photobacterium sp. CCB-ST2H9]UTM57031.1 hypothetical protein L4174_014705 [Photobacterium sp. CCB-ST2H9]
MAKKPILNLPRPKNSNTHLDPLHRVIIGGTGSGKTSLVKHGKFITAKAQAVFFDPYENYAGKPFQGQQVRGYHSKADFLKALVKARQGHSAFKIAYIPADLVFDELEFFSAAVWSVLDGRKAPLEICIEELASCSPTAGTLKGKTGELLRGARQYGGIVTTVFQRGQEVPKTITTQSPTWYLCAVNSMNDAKYLSDAKSVPVADIAALRSAKMNKLEINKPIADFIHVEDGVGNYRKGALNCQTGRKVSLTYRKNSQKAA